ncbi:MAG TPA: hypothetical protein VF679_05285, partial [Pedobacter sp.]
DDAVVRRLRILQNFLIRNQDSGRELDAVPTNHLVLTAGQNRADLLKSNNIDAISLSDIDILKNIDGYVIIEYSALLIILNEVMFLLDDFQHAQNAFAQSEVALNRICRTYRKNTEDLSNLLEGMKMLIPDPEEEENKW